MRSRAVQSSTKEFPHTAFHLREVALRIVLPCLVVLLLVLWAVTNPPVHRPTYPTGAKFLIFGLTFAAAILARWYRQRFGVRGRAVLALPDPLYTLYLATLVLTGMPTAVLLAAITPFVEKAPDIIKRPQQSAVALRQSAAAAATMFIAGACYLSVSQALFAHMGSLRANVAAALAASVIIFLGSTFSRALEQAPDVQSLPSLLLHAYTTPAARFQALLLSIGPLLPLADALDDMEAEFAWILFLIPLCVVYYLALVSVRLQQRTEELQITIGELRTARRREAELTDYAALITKAQEDERRRLARELHDDTAQALIALSRGLDSLATRRVDPPLTSRDTTFIDDLNDLAKRTLESVRRACQDLRPSVLDDLGLVAALESLAESVTRRGLPCSFHITGAPALSTKETEVTLYRIAQESLTNARQHAHATEAAIEMRCDPSGIDLRVSDNGEGFDYAALLHTPTLSASSEQEPRSGLGLLGMRERATLIGARLNVKSATGAGTTISLHVPLPQPG
ncbi:MAG: Two-component system sensor histidine kinase [Ktedonobacterales bacterium]|jgi:signal transduction histidine kinase|nr:MAG: Two-component system sensor histidine kinase [Ktedonobacterales bacterium]